MKNAVLVLVFSLSLSATAQQSTNQPATKASAGIPAAKSSKIRQLIQTTGAANMAVDAIRQQLASIKKLLPVPPRAQDDFADQFLAEVKVGELVDLLMPVYDRHFSEADLDGMISFYNTPLGQKVIKEMPQVFAEAQQVGGDWGRDIGMKVGARIGERVRAGDYGPWPPNGSATHPADEQGFKPAVPAPPQK